MNTNMNKKVLLIGGTGAMGVYLVPQLISEGYSVDVTSRKKTLSDNPNLRFLHGNAMDEKFMQIILTEHYDAIVDFMIYPSQHFAKVVNALLSATNQYVFLSSYRVYADRQSPITETAPQLIDVVENKQFLSSDDYSMKKCRGEQILKATGRKNWTIIRPAITYSKLRFQLTTLEAKPFLYRALKGKRVIVPEEALDRQATMTWAGDVAKMISRLLGNDAVLSEAFTVSTSEHHTWREIAGYYHELVGLEIDPVDKETYLRVIQPNKEDQGPRWQLEYDRLYDRLVDNTKILHATGLSQSEFMPLFQGLEKELSCITLSNVDFLSGVDIQNDYMDNYYSLRSKE